MTHPRTQIRAAVVAALGGSTRPAASFVGQEWVAADGTLWRVVQARGDDGQYLPDDPDIAERESLEWAPAP